MNSKLTTTLPTSHRTRAPLAAVVVDEVFASFEHRVDSPVGARPAVNFAAETEQLVANIGRQLQSIEDQKNRLIRLLGDLGVAADF